MSVELDTKSLSGLGTIALVGAGAVLVAMLALYVINRVAPAVAPTA